MFNNLKYALALVALIVATAEAQKSAVLGIDLGSQFFKVAVVKTGGFDTVFNENSKRKTFNALSFIENERLMGDNAYSQKNRYSKNVLLGMNHLIGKTFDSKTHESGEFGSYHLPYAFKKDEKRGTVLYDMNGETYSPDLLMGMIFHNIKDMSQKHIEQTVSECVVTVPYYLTEHERRIIIDAAAMVDLSVIMLVNDNTAVSIRYGIESKTPPGKTNNVLFIDVGASHTTATVTRYFERAVSDYKNVSSVEILGVSHSLAGGTDIDRQLTEHFANEFDEKHKKKIRESPKAISKLRQQVEKIKVVLSANKETVMVIEGLMDDIDFKSKINRETMEKICAKTFTTIEETLSAAIKKSGLNMDEIHQVIPFGAGTRVPKVKELVLKATERETWQASINTDEAAALGAAFVAANFSKSFRLKEYHVYDYFPYSVGIDMNGKKATLFKPGSVMEAKKTISQPLSDEVKEADTMKVTLAYNDEALLPAGTPTGLASYTIQGMKDGLEGLNVTGTPKISIAVGMHRDAIVDVLHAELKVYSMDLINRTRFVKKNVTTEEWVKIKSNATNATNGTNATDASNETEDESNRRSLDEEKKEEDKKEEEKKEEKKEEEKKEEEKKEEKKEEEKKEEEESTWSSLFGSSKKEKNETTDETNATNDTKTKPGYELKNVTKEKTVEIWEEKLEKKLHTSALNLTRKHEGLPALDDEAFKAERAKHMKMVDDEADRKARADAKNSVEAYVFTSREKMDTEGYDTVTTEAERENITASLQTAEDWLWEDGDNVEVKVYQDKVAELKELVGAGFYRLNQLAARASAIESFKEVVADARKRVVAWDEREAKRIEKNETTWVHANETKKVTKLCDEADAWLVEKEEELKTAGLLVKPPFSASEITQQVSGLQAEVHRIRYKAKPKPKYVKKNTTNGSNASNATGEGNESNETNATEEKPETKAEEKTEEKAEEKTEEKAEEKTEEKEEQKAAAPDEL